LNVEFIQNIGVGILMFRMFRMFRLANNAIDTQRAQVRFVNSPHPTELAISRPQKSELPFEFLLKE